MILRPIEAKIGWHDIAEAVGRSVFLVKKWQRRGAPIYKVDGKWTAELAELWAWIKDNAEDCDELDVA